MFTNKYINHVNFLKVSHWLRCPDSRNAFGKRRYWTPPSHGQRCSPGFQLRESWVSRESEKSGRIKLRLRLQIAERWLKEWINGSRDQEKFAQEDTALSTMSVHLCTLNACTSLLTRNDIANVSPIPVLKLTFLESDGIQCQCNGTGQQ